MRSRLVKSFWVLAVLVALVLVTLVAYVIGYRLVRGQDAKYREMEAISAANQGNLVNEDTPGAIPIFIPRSSNMDDISSLLYEQGFIDSPFTFKMLSKFNGFDGNYQAGTHYLLEGMSYDEIMFALTRAPKALSITFLEGETYVEMRDKMLAEGLNIDVNRMDDLVRYPNAFQDYAFVREIKVNPAREWTLQGYLWPDTYRFDPNMDEESILRMFLDNTENKLAEGAYKAKAKEMGMTLEEVLTLSSIVQKEGNIEEMSKIARVFLNRLNQDMPLESCATINYLRLEDGLEPFPWARSEDLKRYGANPYNTYAFPGLTPGPINNPGTLAVEGILWPADEDSWPGASQYLFFCSTGQGENVFSTNLAEHEANIAYYSEQWYQGETREPDSEVGEG